MALVGASTLSILARMAVTAPVISSTVSPRTRSAMSRPPICEGVASPDIITSNALAASSMVRAAPVATLPMSAFNSCMVASMRCFGPKRALGGRKRAMGNPGRPAGGPKRAARGRGSAVRLVPRRRDVEEVLEDQMAILGRDAFGVELDAMHRKPPMREAHHEAIRRFGRDGKVGRQAVAFHYQRMIARGMEGPVDPTEDAGAVVSHLRHLAVHRHGRPHHLAAKGLADRLVAEADAEDRDGGRCLGDQLEADASLVRCARPGR